MSWTLLIALVGVLSTALLTTLMRRKDLRRMERTVRDRERAVRSGSDKAQLQHPVIDLSRCLGCGTCVAVCPEDGVLDLVHGQAMVVNGARCMGVSACERECPVGAITVTLTDLEERNDVPALSESLEATGSPGLFLAGEVTAHALIKTAVEQGSAVAAEVGRRLEDEAAGEEDLLDLCIVGAGPGGIACALEAKRLGLHYLVLEQEENIGGTVAKYPRRKLVLTQPVILPLHGRLRRASYTKEELMELWQGVVDEHRLEIATGVVFTGLERDPAGHYVVHTESGTYAARNVCLALGRRGVPRRLGVPGEDLPKVAYSLMDANSYRGRRILVVGGGDSAVETAMGLAEQPGNRVTLAYRKESFFRIRARNEERLQRYLDEGRLKVLFNCDVAAIHGDSVDLVVRGAVEPVAVTAGAASQRTGSSVTAGGSGAGGGTRKVRLPNDEVFVMAGGVPPIELLQRSGVSFDPSLREGSQPIVEQGTGLIRALSFGLVMALGALAWALWHGDYYLLDLVHRPTHDKHQLLRPGMGIGLGLGIASAVLIVLNLLYLVRRSGKLKLGFGSLRLWMTSHVATGILAFLCAMLHGAMVPGDSPGGRAFLALAVLLITGAIGRYFYSYVPRAANGRELELAEVKARLGRISEEWDQGQRIFREHARQRVEDLVAKRQWRGSFFGRVLALLGVQRGLRRILHDISREGAEQGVAEDQIRETLDLARRAHRTALMAAHYEDLRAVLNTWRWLHRWVAALLVLLVVVHIVHALSYSAYFTGGGG